MATDFNKNAVSSAGGFKPSSVDTPIDIRARVETEADILTIPKPYIGMIVYVNENGKRYEVLSLKDGKVGVLTVKNGLVDQYREILVSYNDLTDKPEIPSVEGLASEQYVQDQIAAIPEVDLESYATKEEMEQGLSGKVDIVEGKSLLDDSEIERLAGLSNYDDTELRDHIDEKADKTELFSKDYNDLLNLPEIPSVEGLASEQYVQDQIAAIPEVDLSGKVDKEEGKSLVDDSEIEKLAGVEEGANNYVLPIASTDSLGGVKAGSNIQITQDGVINGANYQFKINIVENGIEPSVEMQGEFPNIIVVFNIPNCIPAEVEPQGKMWYGCIPCDESGITGWNDPSQVMENLTQSIIQFGLDAGTLVEAEPEAIGKISLNVNEGDWICAILPKDSNLVAYMDNGAGQQVTFEKMEAAATGFFADGLEIIQPINDIYYVMYGMPDSNGGGNYIMYINEK